MLTYICNIYRLFVGVRADMLYNLLRIHFAVSVPYFHRMFFIPSCYLCYPLVMICFFHFRYKFSESFFAVSYYVIGDIDILVHFALVHIYLKNPGFFSELIRFKSNSVAEPRAESKNEIGFADAFIGGIRSVHSEHSEIFFLIGGYGAHSHKCGYNRNTCFISQFHDFVMAF